MRTTNLALAVLDRASRQPDKLAFVMAGRPIPYSRVAALVVNFARRMQGLRISRQSIVGLAIRDMPTATIATLAVALLGGRWVPVSSTSASVYPGTTHVLAAGPAAKLPGRVAIDQSWYNAPPLPPGIPPFPGHADPDDAWMIAHSSGTTGKPKFMAISYGNVWRRIGNPELQDGAAPTTWNLFPPTSAHGARVNTGNLVLGGTNVAAAPWPELLRLGVNRVIGSPAQVSAAIFDRVEPPSRRIRSLKVAGAQVTQKFVATALTYFEELHLAYGATEVGAVTLWRLTATDQFDGGAGRPGDGAEIEIVDEASLPVTSGSEGIVRLRTPSIVPGYVNEPALTADAFRGGWFHPGDRGFLDSTGSLHITGRLNDVLNAGGMKLNASDLDEIIQLHPSVADGYCFMLPDAQGVDVLSAMVSLRPGATPESLGTLRAMATASLGRSRAPHRAYVAESMPRNESGKPMRAAAAQLASRLEPIELPA